jgi:hypothetical protein
LYCTTIKNPIDMKTIIFSSRKSSLFTLAGLLLLLTASCGSYQNSSYYDADGIYGNTYRGTVETNRQNNQNQYKEYFGSLRDDNQSPEVFTDIDNYNDYNLDNNQENYPGWGSNPQGVNMNVYDTGWAMNNWYGNNWGLNGGFGWGMNNWYGNNWGMNNWGWNGNYGLGMNFGFSGNNWYGNNFYGNNWGYPNNYSTRAYSYNPSRRGSSYSNTADTNRSYSLTSRRFSNDRNNSNSQTFSRERRNTDRSSNTTDFRRGGTNDNFNRNTTNQNDSYNIPSRTRTDVNSSRRGNETPTRSYAPAINSSRNESYSPNRSSYPSSNSSRNEGYSPSRSSSPSSSSGRSSQGSSRRGGR